MSRICFGLAALIALTVSLTGCGGGGGGSGSPSGTLTTSTSAKAADFTGSWTGTYAADNGVGTPVTLSLVGDTASNAVTGDMYSARLAGNLTGTVDGTGIVSGTVVNSVDKLTWNVQLGLQGNTLSIIKATYDQSSLGTGSCTATPKMTADMSGTWKGTMNERDIITQNIIAGTTQVVDVKLAFDSTYNQFVGAIVSDKGLVARLTFKVSGGQWYATIDQAMSWGVIPAPQNGTMPTQGVMASTAAMEQSFKNNANAPADMQHIMFSEAYNDTNTFLRQTYFVTSYKAFTLALSRP